MNEESPECKKIISNCLTSLFKKVRQREMDTLFDMIIMWFNDKKVGNINFYLQYSQKKTFFR